MNYPKDYNEKDIKEFYQEAVDLVKEMGYVSVSLLQRRFMIGYARAVRLLDIMEENKIITGPLPGKHWKREIIK